MEREFPVIGEAVKRLSRIDPALSSRISHARMIVGFRNQFVHDCVAIVDKVVGTIALNDAPILREECAKLIRELQEPE